MYVGVVTILVGWCVLWDSRTLPIYTLVMMCAFYASVILVEEPWAARDFGGQWEAYRARVPRWFI
jgi:protein-S-isoprenylcysteine O-methyltransferase Ste14